MGFSDLVTFVRKAEADQAAEAIRAHVADFLRQQALKLDRSGTKGAAEEVRKVAARYLNETTV